jgi:hypothetical protein
MKNMPGFPKMLADLLGKFDEILIKKKQTNLSDFIKV